MRRDGSPGKGTGLGGVTMRAAGDMKRKVDLPEADVDVAIVAFDEFNL